MKSNDERGLARRGSTMLTVLILMGTMTVLALVFMRVGQGMTAEQLGTVEGARTTYLAEAGISEAIEAIRSGQSGDIGRSDDPAYLGGGVLWVEATDLGAGRTQLDSMAMKDGGRAALRIVVENGAGGGARGPGGGGTNDAFYTMLFSNKNIQLTQDIEVDSWDSALGTYVSQATNTKDGFTYADTAGGASSNGTVQLDGGVHVFGEVHTGPGYALNQSATAYVSGATTPSPASVPLAQITVPVIASSGACSVANNGTKTINPGTCHYTSLIQGKSSMLIIIGPATLVLDGYSTGVSATLEVDCTNGPVRIYDTGVWSVDKNYKVQPKAGTPVDAAFLISSTGTVQFDQGSKISFGFYAPNATIQVDQTAEVWGALVADQITVGQGTKFHFDENLRSFRLPWSVPDSVLGPGEDVDPEVVSWSRIPFPAADFLGDRRDPFTLLGLDKADLRAPAAAWEGPKAP